MSNSDKPIPAEISRYHDKDVKVAWKNGAESVFAARSLRLACTCAGCVEEMSGKSLIDPKQIPQDVRPQGIRLVGRYALQIDWSDGHNTGIYTFDYLWKLAQEK